MCAPVAGAAVSIRTRCLPLPGAGAKSCAAAAVPVRRRRSRRGPLPGGHLAYRGERPPVPGGDEVAGGSDCDGAVGRWTASPVPAHRGYLTTPCSTTTPAQLVDSLSRSCWTAWPPGTPPWSPRAGTASILRDAVDGDPRVHILERGDVYRARTPTAITTFRQLAEERSAYGVAARPRRRRGGLRGDRARLARVAALRVGHQQGARRLAAVGPLRLRHPAPARARSWSRRVPRTRTS